MTRHTLNKKNPSNDSGLLPLASANWNMSKWKLDVSAASCIPFHIPFCRAFSLSASHPDCRSSAWGVLLSTYYIQRKYAKLYTAFVSVTNSVSTNKQSKNHVQILFIGYKLCDLQCTQTMCNHEALTASATYHEELGLLACQEPDMQSMR